MSGGDDLAEAVLDELARADARDEAEAAASTAATGRPGRRRTADEVAHDAALPLVDELVAGEAVAVVVVSTRDARGCRTAFRFVHCPDRKTQVKALREMADILEGKRGELDVPS